FLWLLLPSVSRALSLSPETLDQAAAAAAKGIDESTTESTRGEEKKRHGVGVTLDLLDLEADLLEGVAMDTGGRPAWLLDGMDPLTSYNLEIQIFCNNSRTRWFFQTYQLLHLPPKIKQKLLARRGKPPPMVQQLERKRRQAHQLAQVLYLLLHRLDQEQAPTNLERQEMCKERRQYLRRRKKEESRRKWHS
ncbi:unnamed protein product, partial [Urochloa humidicola]